MDPSTAVTSELQPVNESTGSAAIPARLVKRDRERQEEAERRKEHRDKQYVTEESLDYVCGALSAERAAVEQLLLLDGTGAGLEEAAARIQRMHKLVNDSAAFLPQYELRQAQATLNNLQEALNEKRDALLPKKKFTFRSRTGTKTQAPAASDKPAAPKPQVGASTVDAALGADECGFSNAHSQALSKSGAEIQGRHVLLTNLTGCRVKLAGSPATLYVKDVRDSQILCGPVRGSAFVDRCSGCTLALACQQLRTHNTEDTRVYLHVTSRAIVEDCSGVSFAPFSWSYRNMDADFQLSGLDRDRNNWAQVDDFNWLAADKPSPNWSIIPEAERKTSWD